MCVCVCGCVLRTTHDRNRSDPYMLFFPLFDYFTFSGI